jgi:hypothetical protein
MPDSAIDSNEVPKIIIKIKALLNVSEDMEKALVYSK